MVYIARPSPAWPGLLTLALVGCFADPPMVSEDTETTGATANTGTSVTTTITTTTSATTTPMTGDTTGLDSTSMDSTATSTDPDTTDSSSTGPDPMACDAIDGQPDDECPGGSPFCVGGSCVPCGGGGDCSAIDPLTPICGPGDVCRPCVEHDECPGDAGCHLFEGSCLPSDQVYYADPDANCGPGDATEAMPACGIQQALIPATGEPQVTLRLAQSVYLEQITISAGRVIAIIGEGETTIVTSGGDPSVTVQGTAYLGTIDVQNFDISASSMESSGDVWLDDSMVRNSEIGLDSSAGRVVLRRSRVLGNRTIGVRLAGGEEARFINTIVAGNGDGFPATSGGIVTEGPGPVDVLYSTIVENFGNDGGAIDCGPGIATVRNSIVASEMLSNAIDCGAGTTVTYSVVTDSQFNGDPTNYSLLALGDLFLDIDYEIGMGSVATNGAQWEDGDPPDDINGVARPGVAGASDFAGANIPN